MQSTAATQSRAAPHFLTTPQGRAANCTARPLRQTTLYRFTVLRSSENRVSRCEIWRFGNGNGNEKSPIKR